MIRNKENHTGIYSSLRNLVQNYCNRDWNEPRVCYYSPILQMDGLVVLLADELASVLVLPSGTDSVLI